MASSASEDFGQALAQLVQLVFSLLFPLMLVVTCAAAFVLTIAGFPQFSMLAGVSIAAVEYAKAHLWAMAALIVFVLMALPLARVAYREQAAQTSGVIGAWVAAVIAAIFTAWLATAWPNDNLVVQQIVFAILLFATCGGVCEAVIGTLKLAAINRPQPGPEIVEAQKAHGDAQIAGEAEALALLSSRK